MTRVFVAWLVTICAFGSLQAQMPFFIQKQDSVTLLVEQGKDVFMQAKFDSAISLYSKALEIKPNSVDIVLNRAIAHAAANNDKQMAKDIELALKLPCDDPNRFISAGNMFYRLQKRKEAVKMISNGIKKQNNVYAMAYIQRARVFHDLHKRKEACRDYENAVDMGYSGMNFGLADYCEKYMHISSTSDQ